MKILKALIKRNIKLFFKDKVLFLTSLITPVILLILYAVFLGGIFTDTLQSLLPEGYELDKKIINGFAGAQLLSSVLSVSCITVAFSSNLLMVQDKANGTIKDLTVSPVRSYTMSLGYYIATFISTLIVCLVATLICFGYVAIRGWFFSPLDVLLIVSDVVLLCLFGVALSSVVNFFLSSQGQMSAVSTIVSTGYGYVSGAYMPTAQFPEFMQRIVSLLPGTYGTGMVRNHALRGVFSAMESDGLPKEFIDGVRDGFDCNLYFFDNKVSLPVMYIVVFGTILLLVGIYVLMNFLRSKKARKE
jgi:multidrug/hemolysin transport system permease protein